MKNHDFRWSKRNNRHLINFILLLVMALSSSYFSLAISQSTVDSLERHWKPNVEKLRIISYNIFNGFNWGKDEDREQRFIEWIIDKDPEVLALQELCGFTKESLLGLARKWGHEYAEIVKEDGYPVGITSKEPIIVKNKIVDNVGHGLLHVETYGYDFLVTHLNPSNTRKRLDEASIISEYIKKERIERFMLMGDMNSHSPMDADFMEENATNLIVKYGRQTSTNLRNGRFDYSVISHFLSYPMIDVCREYVTSDKRATFPTPILMNISKHKSARIKIEERIDYIFVSESMLDKVVDAFIYNQGKTKFLSDHFPVGVDLLIEGDKQN